MLRHIIGYSTGDTSAMDTKLVTVVGVLTCFAFLVINVMVASFSEVSKVPNRALDGALSSENLTKKFIIRNHNVQREFHKKLARIDHVCKEYRSISLLTAFIREEYFLWLILVYMVDL